MSNTVIVYLESRAYAQGIAVMDEGLYNSPEMQEALEAIRKRLGADYVTESVRKPAFAALFRELEGNTDRR